MLERADGTDVDLAEGIADGIGVGLAVERLVR